MRSEDLAELVTDALCSPHLLGEYWSREHWAHRASRGWDYILTAKI